MALSVHMNKYGAIWPLGFIGVVTPGTPVGIMSVVDPNGFDDPSYLTNPATGMGQGSSPTCHKIFVSAFKPVAAGHGLQPNSGNIYVVMKPQGAGSGNRDDTGAMVWVLMPGTVAEIPPSGGEPITSLSGYSFLLDADNAGDGGLVLLVGNG